MRLSFTGHRPSKLGGYTPEAAAKLQAFAEQILAEHCPTTVISGMALGWDSAVAEAALSLGIPLIAVAPFWGQECRWPVASQQAYHRILRGASEIKYTSDALYSPALMQKRNEWMVDNSEMLIALWNGSPGGTANCIRYARAQGKLIKQVWLQWIKFQAPPANAPGNLFS